MFDLTDNLQVEVGDKLKDLNHYLLFAEPSPVKEDDKVGFLMKRVKDFKLWDKEFLLVKNV